MKHGFWFVGARAMPFYYFIIVCHKLARTIKFYSHCLLSTNKKIVPDNNSKDSYVVRKGCKTKISLDTPLNLKLWEYPCLTRTVFTSSLFPQTTGQSQDWQPNSRDDSWNLLLNLQFLWSWVWVHYLERRLKITMRKALQYVSQIITVGCNLD